MDDDEAAQRVIIATERVLSDPFMRMAANEAALASRQQITELIDSMISIRMAFGRAARSIENDELVLYCFAALMTRYGNVQDAETVMGGALATAIIMLMEREELIRTLAPAT